MVIKTPLYARVEINGTRLPTIDLDEYEIDARHDVQDLYEDQGILCTILNDDASAILSMSKDVRELYQNRYDYYVSQANEKRAEFIKECKRREAQCKAFDRVWWRIHRSDVRAFFGEFGVILIDGTYWAVTEAHGARQLKLK